MYIFVRFVLKFLYSRNLIRNIENTKLLHHFALNNGLLNFLFTSWINGIKNCCNFEIFRNEIILNDVAFVINSIVKIINKR